MGPLKMSLVSKGSILHEFTHFHTCSPLPHVGLPKGKQWKKKGNKLERVGPVIDVSIDYHMYGQRKQFTILCTVNPKREQ